MSAWERITMPSSRGWNNVIYANGKFVAVGVGGYAAYSTDGVTWINSTMPSASKWRDVAYGNGKFVAVSNGHTNNIDHTNKAAYSTDGVTWTAATLPASAYWVGIVYASGKFVAVSEAGHVAYSTDGITWESSQTPNYSTSAGISDIAYGDGKFVAISGKSYSGVGRAYYSTDGITWNFTSIPVAVAWKGITYGNNRFVAVGTSSSGVARFAYSVDGISWQVSSQTVSSCYMANVTYGNEVYVATSGSYIENSTVYANNKVFYSTDGISWTTATLPSNGYWYALAHGNGKFVTISYQSAVGYYISDDLVGNAVLSLQASPSTGGTLNGAGTYSKGVSVTVKAVPANGWEFVEWQHDSETVSTNATYTFTITADILLIAVFKQKLTAWVGVNGKARKGVEMWVGVNGKARKVTAAWIGVNGKARRFL